MSEKKNSAELLSDVIESRGEIFAGEWGGEERPCDAQKESAQKSVKHSESLLKRPCPC